MATSFDAARARRRVRASRSYRPCPPHVVTADLRSAIDLLIRLAAAWPRTATWRRAQRALP